MANEATTNAGGFAFWPMAAMLTADGTPGHGAEGGRMHGILLGGTRGAAEDCGRNLFTGIAFCFGAALAAEGDLDFSLQTCPRPDALEVVPGIRPMLMASAPSGVDWLDADSGGAAPIKLDGAFATCCALALSIATAIGCATSAAWSRVEARTATSRVEAGTATAMPLVHLVARNAWIAEKALGDRRRNAPSPSDNNSRTHSNKMPPAAALSALSSAAADLSRHDMYNNCEISAHPHADLSPRMWPTHAPNQHLGGSHKFVDRCLDRTIRRNDYTHRHTTQETALSNPRRAGVHSIGQVGLPHQQILKRPPNPELHHLREPASADMLGTIT